MKLDKLEVYTNSNGETSTKAILLKEEKEDDSNESLWVTLSIIITLCAVAVAMLWIGMSI